MSFCVHGYNSADLPRTKRRESQVPEPSEFDHVSKIESNGRPSIALTLAKNAGMGQPRWERCTQRSLEVGHPPLFDK